MDPERKSRWSPAVTPWQRPLGRSPRPGAILRRLWSHTGTRIAAAAGAAVTSGLITAVIMPRGPVTSIHALLLMALGLLIGIAAGFILRSRWAMLLAPIAHIAAFETARVGETGATVDGVHLDSTFGIIAFILMALFAGPTKVIPMAMALGTIYISLMRPEIFAVR